MGAKPRLAFIGIKALPHYRREAFEAGCERLGFSVCDEPSALGEGDLAIFWNLQAQGTERTAAELKARGSRIVVAENGYAGRDVYGHQLYALALDGHNGSGRWYVGSTDRLSKFGIEPEPEAELDEGAPFLVCGQRGIGSAAMASPPAWNRIVAAQIGKRFAVRDRPHPGQDRVALEALDAEIASSRGVVIWSSAAGVRALIMGYPVWYAAPRWVCATGATRYTCPDDLERPNRNARSRECALHAMSWAQWSVQEIASGEPLALLLSLDRVSA